MAVAGTILSPAVAAIPAHAEKAVAPEKNPPGDIPDTQVFIDYTSPEGFTLKSSGRLGAHRPGRWRKLRR